MVSLYISSNLGHFINVPVRFEYLRSCSLNFNDGTRPQSTCEYAPLQPLGGNVLLLSFAYVCPEPVLAYIRFVVQHGAKNTRLLTSRLLDVGRICGVFEHQVEVMGAHRYQQCYHAAWERLVRQHSTGAPRVQLTVAEDNVGRCSGAFLAPCKNNPCLFSTLPSVPLSRACLGKIIHDVCTCTKAERRVSIHLYRHFSLFWIYFYRLTIEA